MLRSKRSSGQYRKILAFYRLNFNYIPPFQVLCDSDIIHEALKKGLYLKQTLPNMLSASAQPVVTSCVISDLRRRGNEYSSAALFAKRATRLPCNHEGTLPAVDCLLHCLESNSGPKVFMAAANRAMVNRMASIPGIPLISILNQTKLTLRPPSKASLNYVLRRERSKTMAISDADKVLLARVAEAEKAHKPTLGNNRRHKRAKGPNPLSVKKSKKPPEMKKKIKAGANATSEYAVSVEKNKESPGGKRNGKRTGQSSNLTSVNNAKVLESKDLGHADTPSRPSKIRRKDTGFSFSGQVSGGKTSKPSAMEEDIPRKYSRTQRLENRVNEKCDKFISMPSLKAAVRDDQEEKHSVAENPQGAKFVSESPAAQCDVVEKITSPKTETVETGETSIVLERKHGKGWLGVKSSAVEEESKFEHDVVKRKKQRKNRRRRPQKKAV